jgi:hypothetical protein
MTWLQVHWDWKSYNSKIQGKLHMLGSCQITKKGVRSAIKIKHWRYSFKIGSFGVIDNVLLGVYLYGVAESRR